MTQGIAKRSIHETLVAVIDLETTGLTPGYDGIVEVLRSHVLDS
jgi:DNA polymerase III alpha subunit (gram-positive type)